MFAYEPLDGYRDERDAVELPWEQVEVGAEGRGVAELFADEGGAERPEDRRPST